MCKVSFVVPCYNSSATIERCIDSILAQTFSNIELIIIDDGSADDTVALVQNYKKRDSRIKLIKQKHGGPNMAREAGVKKASGEYIMFVDSDDYIVEDAVEILVKAMKKYNIDHVRFNGINTSDRAPVQPILKPGKNAKIINGQEIIKLLLTTYQLNSLWSQIYRADKLKKIKAFHSGIVFGEDFLVNLEFHQNTDKMLILGGKPLYYYCNNPNSTTRSTDKNRILSNISDRIYISNQAIRYAQKNIKDNNLKNQIIYSQIKMIKASIIEIDRIRNYTKNQFVMDMNNILDADSFSNIDKIDLKRYMKKINLLMKIKNYRVVLAILSLDFDYIWRYINIYRVCCWRKK